MAFFEGCPVGWGGGTHRSWPGGRGGWLGGARLGGQHWSWLGGRGKGSGGGARASVPGG